MPNGFGYRGGWGFGFRGSSPPWPHVGLGRGGLPRCGYFLAGTPEAPHYAHYYGAAWGMPYAATPGATPFAPQMTREQEIDYLRNEAEVLRENLEQIEARISELEAEG